MYVVGRGLLQSVALFKGVFFGDVQLALGSTPEALEVVQSVVVPSQQSPLSWDSFRAFHNIEDREANSFRCLFARPQGDVLGTENPMSKHSSTNFKASFVQKAPWEAALQMLVYAFGFG